MRVVQTFWSGGKDPLIDSFGWLTPQHHLMSWALSCLALKKNYDEVVLYTDSIGYAVFAEKLSLPYTKIIIQYDNLDCHSTHWAYSKLLTYSLQDKPFIHVDGDVFLPKRLDPALESAGLIAQNWEIGTSECYGVMMKNIKEKTSTVLPQFLSNAISMDFPPSYNAGVIGGNDLEFIKEYCDQAFQFIERNSLRYPNEKELNVNHNILFEQVLFAALTKEKGKKVATVLDHSIKDNGYSYSEFCDFYQFENTKLLHMIGGHKRNQRVCELMERMLLNKYPEYYSKVVNVFGNQHKRIGKKYISDNSYHNYHVFIEKLSTKWENIDNEELLNLEKLSSNYFEFIQKTERKKLKYNLKCNPYIEIYEDSKKWASETKELMRNKIDRDFKADSFDIVCIPTLLGKGYKEVLISDLSYNILAILETEQTFNSLLDKLDLYIENAKDKPTDWVVDKAVEHLLYHKLIYVTGESANNYL